VSKASNRRRGDPRPVHAVVAERARAGGPPPNRGILRRAPGPGCWTTQAVRLASTRRAASHRVTLESYKLFMSSKANRQM